MTIYKLLSLRNDLRAVRKNRVPQRIARRAAYRGAFRLAGWLLRAIGLSLLLAVSASAQEREPRPLRETLHWVAPLAAASTFDRQTSLAWSSHPSNCAEGNLSRRNPDGTLNGRRALVDDAWQTAAAAGALYLSKRLRWRAAEWAAKLFIAGQTANYAWYGVSSLRLCHAVSQ